MGKKGYTKSFRLHNPEGTGSTVALILFAIVFVAAFAAIVSVMTASIPV